MKQTSSNHLSLLQKAVGLHKTGNIKEAAVLYHKILKSNPNETIVLSNLATIALHQGEYQNALTLFNQSLAINPNQPVAQNNKGGALKALNQLDDALSCYHQAILLKPDYAEAYNNQGILLHEFKQYADALESYNFAISLKPDYVNAYNNRGLSLQALLRSEEALQSFDYAISLNPNFIEAHNNKGVALQELNLFEDSLVCFNIAIELSPKYADAFNNRGHSLQMLKRTDDAIDSYNRAIQLNPTHANAFNNLGCVMHEKGLLKDALINYKQAIKLNPNHANAYNNAGNVFQVIDNVDEALDYFNKAIEINPEYAEAYNNRANLLNKLRQYDDALADFNKVNFLKPDQVEINVKRGMLLQVLKRLDEAIECYERALELNPDYRYLLGVYFLSKLHICDWGKYNELLHKILDETLKCKEVSTPFSMLAFTDDVRVQQKSAEIYATENHLEDKLPKLSKYPKHPKIRLGYFSADYHDHATMHLIAELLEFHDKSKFEVFAFSFGPDQQSIWRKRAIESFDHFFDVKDKTDTEITELARSLEIDIAIDLKGFTQYARPNIFAERASPVQINYLGYPGTMGTKYMDYIIADQELIPTDKREYYSEKIIYMPNSYQVNMSKRLISEQIFTREELGISKDAFVYCCFNANYKITPSTFAIWMSILKNVTGSILWLFKNGDMEMKNLLQSANSYGIDNHRLVFSNFIPIDEHLKRIQLADLFLDTFPVNAHTTASDALRVGLPIVTLVGESFASRVASSLLNSLDLNELITSTYEDYEALAIKLAQNPKQLKAIKSKLNISVKESSLFDSQLYTKHIEAAYQKVYQRYQDDLLPDHIYIDR